VLDPPADRQLSFAFPPRVRDRPPPPPVDLADRARGSLLGCAWGDVLGLPVESWKPADIEQVYGEYRALPTRYPLDAVAALSRRKVQRLRPLGLHSDDTQQALALLSVCMEPGGFTPGRWGEVLVRGMWRRAWRGYGRNFKGAVARLRAGHDPRQVGSDSAGIGGAMRVTALGALYRDDPDALARVAVESTLVTHAELRAAAIAYAVAWAAAALVRGEEAASVRAGLPAAVAEIEEIWRAPLGWRVDISGGAAVSEGLAGLLADLPDEPAAVRERVCEVAAGSLDPGLVAGRRTKPHPNGGYALCGGAHALAVALADAVDPAWALGELVGLGYDTDTAGAIAGGLLGARFGCGWIPASRISDATAVAAWSDAVASRAGPAEPLEALLEREARMSDEEARFQEDLAAEYDDPWGDLWSPF